MNNNLVHHITKLLLDNDCVIVPGFGGFMAHHKEAYVNGENGRFYPPSRTLGFNQQLTMNDSLLVQSYVETYDMSYPEALSTIEEEVSSLKRTIESAGKYHFSGLGTITIGESGKYDFAPCPSGIPTPSLFALEAFETEHVSAANNAVSGTTKPHTVDLRTVSDTTISPDLAESGDTSAYAAENVKRNNSGLHILRNLAAACIIIMAFILMPKPASQDNGQPASARIDTGLLLKMMPKDITTGQPSDTAMKMMAKAIAGRSKAAGATLPDATASAQDTADAKSYFTIVLASKVSRKGAEQFVRKLRSECKVAADISSGRSDVMVTFGRYTSFSEANKVRNRLTDNIELSNSWILQVDKH